MKPQTIIGPVDCRVLRIIDGDTFVCTVPDWPPLFGQEISVRVAGVNAPELSAKDAETRQRALDARRFAEATLRHARRVTLSNVQRCMYFRLVADVTADGISYGHALLQRGHAVPYTAPGKRQQSSIF